MGSAGTTAQQGDGAGALSQLLQPVVFAASLQRGKPDLVELAAQAVGSLKESINDTGVCWPATGCLDRRAVQGDIGKRIEPFGQNTGQLGPVDQGESTFTQAIYQGANGIRCRKRVPQIIEQGAQRCRFKQHHPGAGTVLRPQVTGGHGRDKNHNSGGARTPCGEELGLRFFRRA